MDKNDLIKDLQDPSQSAYICLKKGYLHHFKMDDELFPILNKKLTQEANFLGLVLETYIKDPHSISQEQMVELNSKAEQLESVVFNVCLSNIQKLPYISKSINQIQKKLSPKFIEQFKQKQNQGFEVIADDESSNLKIVNLLGQLVHTSRNPSIKEILSDWGVDTTHSEYYLLFFALIPKEDIESYRKLYIFSNFFNFV